MDTYEQFIQIYLTVNEKKRFFILPQAHISLVNWDAYIDFIALSFREKKIYLIEVTKSWDCKGPLSRLTDNNSEIIEKHVRDKIIPDELKDYTIEWLFFVRNKRVSWLDKHEVLKNYREQGKKVSVDAIEVAMDYVKDTMP